MRWYDVPYNGYSFRRRTDMLLTANGCPVAWGFRACYACVAVLASCDPAASYYIPIEQWLLLFAAYYYVPWR